MPLHIKTLLGAVFILIQSSTFANASNELADDVRLASQACTPVLAASKFGSPSEAVLAAPSTICFFGEINSNSVTDFEKLLDTIPESRKPYLVVRSLGGEVDSAIRMGKLVTNRDFTVIVYSSCASSCANYLFLPASRRIILEDSVVMLHGGITPGFITSLEKQLDEESRKSHMDNQRIYWLKRNIDSAPAQMQEQEKLLASSHVDPHFFEFFDEFNEMPSSKRPLGCRSRKLEMLSFSEAYLEAKGVHIETNLGPHDAKEFRQHWAARDSDGAEFCWWDR